MKTSIIVSGIAALCLMITFAEAPRRHGEENMNVNSNNNISFVTVNMANMLPGVEVTSFRSKKNDIAASREDFSYLKFNSSNFEKAATETESMPEASEADFNYLKFDASKYFEINPTAEPKEMPVKSDLSYLKFDASKYSSNTETKSAEELPGNEFSNLKFDVNKFYTAESSNMDDISNEPATEVYDSTM
jgi:hypothetical protein